jgi:GNAT superfamily N-acetyltransferase
MTDRYELRTPGTPEEWAAYHAIRREVLFKARGQGAAYDPNHPDEHSPGNYPKVLVVDDRIVAVIRIDLAPPLAIFRRVAVQPGFERRGFGTLLLRMAEDFARQQGCAVIRSSVAPDAVGFYLKCGFEPSGQAGTNSEPIAMSKPLVPMPPE